MPIHDWTRVDAGIFHALHHGWIEEIARSLNRGLLPGDYYALPEQFAGPFGPDVLALTSAKSESSASESNGSTHHGGNGNVLTKPRLKPVAETDLEYYRRKQKVIAVRHVTGDELVAIVEIVSSGNKKGRKALRMFVEKAAQFLDQGIHLLIIDLYPPGRLDPNGIHGEIWQEVSGQEYEAPSDKRLTLAAYETGNVCRAYVEHVAVGDALPDMPLFLEEQKTVDVPLETTYNSAFKELPHRWRSVVEQ